VLSACRRPGGTRGAARGPTLRERPPPNKELVAVPSAVNMETAPLSSSRTTPKYRIGQTTIAKWRDGSESVHPHPKSPPHHSKALTTPIRINTCRRSFRFSQSRARSWKPANFEAPELNTTCTTPIVTTPPSLWNHCARVLLAPHRIPRAVNRRLDEWVIEDRLRELSAEDRKGEDEEMEGDMVRIIMVAGHCWHSPVLITSVNNLADRSQVDSQFEAEARRQSPCS
jgi:hypothetical protein